MINKVLSGLITIGFMAIVRPDKSASMAGVALISVALYEALAYCIDYIRKVNKKQKEKHYITLTKADMRRWADEWITPAIREVR